MSKQDDTVINGDSDEENGRLTVLNPTQKSIDPLDIYMPTPREADLLAILTDPYHRMSSVRNICERAGISRTTYFNMLKKPGFMDYYRARIKLMVKEIGGQLVNLGIREARKGSFQHWKVLMEMAELHSDKKETEHTGELVINVRFADPNNDGDT